MSDFVIVNTETMSIYTFCNNEAEFPAKIAAANNSVIVSMDRLLDIISGGKDTEGYYQRQYEDRKKQLNKYVAMTYDEFKKQERERLLSLPLHEITEERFYEMLNVLPPIKWTRRDNVEMFCMSEMFTGTYTDQYAHDHNTGKYFCKLVDLFDESTWIHNYL